VKHALAQKQKTGELIQLSVKYILTKWTCFVAVEERNEAKETKAKQTLTIEGLLALEDVDELSTVGWTMMEVVEDAKAEDEEPIPTSTVGVDDFELLQVVGRGSFGKVLKVRQKNSREIYAMKVIKS
jgi:hypothetical protein